MEESWQDAGRPLSAEVMAQARSQGVTLHTESAGKFPIILCSGIVVSVVVLYNCCLGR